ncbi:peptidase U32 family protein [Spirochaeta africana]|uniref:Collagenase-like protease n=1 Tax=Spirochaeta africana (strain ATCC 700263 / DSM 8902 / Z-7692) TaxID=889378 RepID=H9UK13_SPIAZ|nr:peptidase U32 family protein [Spirochaeta africana]AFG37856.1 collagenase-like protease [Spirochaeta africana DSM 8902]
MDRSVPELLAPAGSLDSAYYALQAGADAVYFGLQRFSARAAARNFSYDDARRLRWFSRRLGRRIYAAVNTLLTDQELADFHQTAAFLDYLEVDGVILQDPGAAAVLQQLYPHIPRHGSTQLAVHDSDGVHWAQRLGLQRMVLAREVSGSELAELQADLPPGMELEYFIHGAQCYGFSGLCLASGVMLGRSANRGACAQICRTSFDGQYPFSADDRSLAARIPDLAAAGVDSLKIEGRMKSPAYVQQTVSWYRGMLDRLASGDTGNPVPPDDAVRTTFARNFNAGCWDWGRKQQPAQDAALVNTEYPGATGVLLGTATQCGAAGFTITTQHELHLRDGLLLRTAAGWKQTGVRQIRSPGGKPLKKLTAGMTGQLESDMVPLAGSEVRLISRHDSTLPAAPAMQLWKPVLATGVLVTDEGLTLSCEHGSQECSLEWMPAKTPGRLFAQLEDVFTAEGEYFRHKARISGNDPGWFYPASRLKSLRRTWVAAIDSTWCCEAAGQAVDGAIIHDADRTGLQKPALTPPDRKRVLPQGMPLPPRGQLQRNGVPFLFPGDDPYAWVTDLAEPVFIPLFPVSLGLPGWDRLDKFLADPQRPLVVLGLGNPAHAERYRKKWAQYPDTAAFLDYGLYVTNSQTLALYRSLLPRLVARMPWIEAPTESKSSAGSVPTAELSFRDGDDATESLPVLPVKGFMPPLFLSRSCHRRNTGGSCRDCHPDTVQRYRLQQGRRGFQALVYRCWTMVMKDDKRHICPARQKDRPDKDSGR